ncbi:MAG TPA: FKBP-type peptidyl-prolyl cis-trans isomerase [Vicinamibacterales bacterium]
MNLVRLATAFLCAIALAGCNRDLTGPSSTQPFSSVDLTPGTGTAAATGLNLTVDYTGWLFDPSKADNRGLVFDTSIGKTPLTFTLGVGQVIKGWDQGLVGMKVGGVRRLVVPPSLGYGEARYNNIPPYATLLFDITLEDVVNPNATTTSTSESTKTSHR